MPALGHSRVVDSDSYGVDGGLFSEQDLVDDADMMSLAGLGVDEGWLLGELWKDLERGEHAESVLAEAEMRRVIEFNQSLEHGFVPGMGQTVARVPLSVYTHWVARYGPEFWRQKDSLDFILKRAGGGAGNPGFIIKSRGKPQITVDGFRDRAPASNFSGPAVDAATGGHGERPAGAAQAAPAAPRPVRGRRGRWAK